ncbi:microtubule binding motor protein [Lithospermum erythrorhizon]|uniref:Kinesin-like protein n=1 Tax=Lithospermum erythrorhizon TaxID=34254 RepID=A0AAV3NQQ2_LITER
MPVSTRSQFIYSSNRQPNSNPNQNQKINPRIDEKDEQCRNPHYGLKEKMKALTFLYEQQKQQAKEPRFSTHPSVDLLSSGRKVENGGKKVKELSEFGNVMKENAVPSSNMTKTCALGENVVEDVKENENVALRRCASERVVGVSGVRKPNGVSSVARKLSMGVQALPVSEFRGGIKDNVEELGGVLGGRGGEGSRILVFVRLRPMGKKEKDSGARCCVRIVNKRDVYLTELGNENDYLRLKRIRGRHFTFDASFPESTTQLEVYSTTTAELVEAVLQGRNGSVFCYGATGAGKTHTMLGSVESPGVMVLAIKDLFNKIRQRSFDGNHVVHLSYLEVYNESVRDLLSPGRPLVLREDKQGIVASGLTQYRAYSTDEVMSLLQQGNRNRTTEPTRANETSSRSHAILQVVVEYHVKDASDNIVNRIGKLSLIDLAGSERALATDQRTLRSLEGANINKSLLALSSCINALVEGKKHIPYRNSKLTQLLKDSLGGACNTVMIANVSPSNLSFGETQNTLHWADRAKEIRTKVCEKNEEILPLPESETDQAKLLLELQKENRELRMQFARQQQKLLAVQAQALAANSSPAPSKVVSHLSPAPSSAQANEKRRTRSSLLSRNCFTPESKRKEADDSVRELRRTMKVLEAEIERMKKNHALQIKLKDDFIRKLSQQLEKRGDKGEETTQVLTRANLRPKEPSHEGELRSPSHRFQSPAPTAKKRSFWDITTANSPSLATLNGRKTRSHVASETTVAPSMLLQPGFARQKQ